MRARWCVAALIVVLMLSGGGALEDYAARRARHDLSSLLDRSPQVAHVVTAAADGSSSYRDVPATEVKVGCPTPARSTTRP